MFGLMSGLSLYLIRALPYQRNRTPVEYEAACSADFNLHTAPFTSLPVCSAGPAAFSYSTATGESASIWPWNCNGSPEQEPLTWFSAGMEGYDSSLKQRLCSDNCEVLGNSNGLFNLSRCSYNKKVCRTQMQLMFAHIHTAVLIRGQSVLGRWIKEQLLENKSLFTLIQQWMKGFPPILSKAKHYAKCLSPACMA